MGQCSQLMHLHVLHLLLRTIADASDLCLDNHRKNRCDTMQMSCSVHPSVVCLAAYHTADGADGSHHLRCCAVGARHLHALLIACRHHYIYTLTTEHVHALLLQ